MGVHDYDYQEEEARAKLADADGPEARPRRARRSSSVGVGKLAAGTTVVAADASSEDGDVSSETASEDTPQAAAAQAGEPIPDLVTIKRAIPASMFRAELPTSLYYAARSCVFVAALGFTLFWAETQPWYARSELARSAVLGTYWLLQGTVFWGIFTIGHDCGHSSFSKFPVVNWIIGNLMHTSILTPYESWRISHRHHHKNTGNIDRDEIFFPMREHEDSRRARWLTALLAPAWYLYLLLGFPPRYTYHFLPSDRLFVARQAAVVGSLVTYAAFVYGLYVFGTTYGWDLLARYYFAPLFVFASWLVLTTFLHHNEEGMEWYGDKTWDYVKGNLSSIDRSYWPFNNIIHDIGTHQIHHLFPIIPHYKLVEATRHFRAAFPHLAKRSDEHFLPAFIKNVWMYITAPPVPSDADGYVYPVTSGKGGESTKTK